MAMRIAFIGFGEAAQAFARAPDWHGEATAFDILFEDPSRADAKRADCARAGVAAADLADALAGSDTVLSLVTADQATIAATAAAAVLSPGTLYLDMNSIAPGSKRDAAKTIETAGGRYVDVAVMAPVHPAQLAVPLLVSGTDAKDAVAALHSIGFTAVRTVARGVGTASAIKMLRSVMIKGIEALTAECMIAAARADLVDEVLAALGEEWRASADYNLDRMLVHGTRRAAELDEVAVTLEALGVTPSLTRAAAGRQRDLGGLGLGSVAGLEAKLAAITDVSGACSA